METLHEPFGDPYWLGSERQLGRYEELRHLSGFANATYKSATERISQSSKASQSKVNRLSIRSVAFEVTNSFPQGKRLFIKEMAFFLFPAQGNPPHLASSFRPVTAEPRNPTLLPRSELAKFQFTFLIRHPYLSVPSYYRLSLPGRKEASCVKKMTTSDLGYFELRSLFDYLREEGLIGRGSGYTSNTKRVHGNGVHGREKSYADHNRGLVAGDGHGISVIDSEDLMEHPDMIMSDYCRNNGIPYNESILSWDRSEDQQRAAAVIDRWGFPVTFHKAVLQSKGLSARKTHGDGEQMYQKWVDEFGVEGADEIKEAADSQLDDYHYLRQFVHNV